ncbi:MAG: AGE family epimerase/isomerase [Verrucomicrobiota bacterium]
MIAGAEIARDLGGHIPPGWDALAAAAAPRLQRELTHTIVPFWQRTLDAERGGVFNCWNNEGTRLVRRDKFSWSQGRFAWLWARLGDAAGRGLIEGEAREFVAHADKTLRFLEAHTFLPDGRCAFLLSEAGEVLEALPGQGPAPSIYADCFVAMGLAEYARVTGDAQRMERAWQLVDLIEARVAAGDFPTHPSPIPAGYEAHGITMIRLNVMLVLHAASERLGEARAEQSWRRCVALTEKIFETFVQPDGRLVELRRLDRAPDDSLLARHINPGHTLECVWMLFAVAARERRADWIARAGEVARVACERGWDETHGGLLHFTDGEGGEPRGAASGAIYERSVREAWANKLWWVHSEAIYAMLLAYRLTGDERARAWFERVCEYALRVFPQPDRAVGEWIQIRDRTGAPVEKVVALPVKDPYHVARNLIQALELFAGGKGS